MIWNKKRPRASVQNEQKMELCSARKDVTQTHHQRPESPTVTFTRHSSKHMVHKRHQRYINSTEDVTLVEFMYLAFTCMLDYRSRLNSLLLCLRDVFRPMINFIVCWRCMSMCWNVKCEKLGEIGARVQDLRDNEFPYLLKCAWMIKNLALENAKAGVTMGWNPWWYVCLSCFFWTAHHGCQKWHFFGASIILATDFSFVRSCRVVVFNVNVKIATWILILRICSLSHGKAYCIRFPRHVCIDPSFAVLGTQILRLQGHGYKIRILINH